MAPPASSCPTGSSPTGLIPPVASALRAGVVIALASLTAACGGGYDAASWDGRRGYDGNGDYGYDLAASRSEARSYRAGAARSYPIPGTPDDPWGPPIREAAARFQVPERWIREVMRQESSGRLYDPDGSLITSSAGAMGLMQVMPRTYDMLRRRYRLGGDPYEPRDNILAGTAYIREMYDRYGAPNFLAAYNAGPDRLDAYLSGAGALPDETENYLARVAPRLGPGVTAAPAFAAVPDTDRAYAGGGMTGQEYAAASGSPPTADPSLRAFDGGGLVTADAPTGILTRQALAPMVVPIAATAIPVATPGGAWGIQVGAYPDPARSQTAIATARARAGEFLAESQAAITPVQRAGLLYRARLVGLSAARAAAACARLGSEGMDCFTVPPGS